jgi:acyl-CoA reductase LuxC
VSRGVDERAADVRRLLDASRAVYEDRQRIAPEIARSTGLTLEGVLYGFSCLERDAADGEVRSLVGAAGDAERVHVVLSANVFVAPLRALAVARAASARVTVRPSPRDPTLARELEKAAGDDAITIVSDRDVASVDRGEIHVYGRYETLAEVRARARPGVRVLGHGPGMGVALVSRAGDLAAAADAIAMDVVPFDQRGCLSPRLVMVEGDEGRGEALAAALHERLDGWDARVPRGELADAERAEATRWRETVRFVGRVWSGAGHVVGFAAWGGVAPVPPPGRHVHVASLPSFDAIEAALAPVARHVVVVGTDDPARLGGSVPRGARVVPLGLMQRPPLDGPVDRRAPSRVG